MGTSRSSPSELKLQEQVARMQIINDEPQHHLMYLEDPTTKKEYILRDVTVPNKQDFLAMLKSIEHKQAILSCGQHVLPITEICSSSSAHFCSSVSKISVLGEYPQRTLDDETCERHLQKRRYNEKQLWTILGSCILGMAHLQRNRISHEAVRSTQIFVENTGLIKVADPFVSGAMSNWQAVTSRAKIGHVYLSPELVSELKAEGRADNGSLLKTLNVFKSDVFSMGVLVLQTGLLEYQDDCYLSKSNDLDWEVLKRKFQRFASMYSEDLCKVLSNMLDRDPQTRESWLELENYVKIYEPEEKRQNPKVVSTNPPTPQIVPKVIGSAGILQYTFGSEGFGFQNGLAATQGASNVQTPIQTPGEFIESQQKRDPRLSPLKKHPSPIQKISRVNPSSISTGTIRPPAHYHCNDRQLSYSVSKRSYLTEKQSNSPTKAEVAASHHEQQTNRKHQEKMNTLSSHKCTADRSSFIAEADNKIQPVSERRNTSPDRPQFVVETFKQGSRYEGYMCNNMRHGKGKFFYQDGGMYDGDWVYNKMTGFGRLYYQSGLLAYEGNWLQDTFNGLGVLHNENAVLLDHPFDYSDFQFVNNFWIAYEGYFKEDLKHGKGKLYLSNDEYYEGNFCEDAVHGSGIFYRADGRAIHGIWKFNRLIDS